MRDPGPPRPAGRTDRPDADDAPSGDAVARLQDITVKRGGTAVLDGLSIAFPSGGVTAVMGPNGAGKSLLLRVLMGLIAPDGGVVSVHPAAAGAMALVFQRPVLLRRSVRGNLDHALRVYRVSRRDRPRRLQELLRMGGLTGLADRPARRLSGGEQQRVAMVRALGARPRLLLLDEPTASLDPQSTGAIEWLIRAAVADGTKAVLVTHDHGQAQRLADDVAFVHHGRLTEHTDRATFFANPASTAAKAYLDGRLLL